MIARMWMMAVVAGTMIAAASGQAVSDWDQWRGPSRNGVAPTTQPLADAWGKDGPTRLWSSERIPSGPVGGYGGMAVVQGRVHVYANHEGDAFYCLDAATGKLLWKTQFPAKPGDASTTPCVTGGRVYGLGSAGTAYCLDAATGKELWHADCGGKYSSFIVADGKAVIVGKGIVALDARTGQRLWEVPDAKGIENAPVLWRSGTKAYIVQNTSDKVLLVELDSGKVVATADGGTWSTAVVAGDLLLVQGGAGLACYRLGQQQPERLWRIEQIRDRGASPAVDGELAYAFANGTLWCVELATGKVKWQGKIAGGEISSPIIADGKVLIVVDNEKVLLVRGGGEKCEVLAQLACGASACTTPTVVGDHLYMRCRDAIKCYDIGK